MRDFILTIVVLGLAIMISAGVFLSWLAASQRRKDTRDVSVRSTAAKFRSLYGQKAGAALDRRLNQGNLSPRGKRFFKLVAAELRRDQPEALRRVPDPRQGAPN